MSEKNTEEFKSCACMNVRRAARVITRFYESALSDARITINQFSILATLQDADRSVTELAGFLNLDRTTVTRTVDRLEEKGFVFTGEGEDARKRLITRTSRGTEAFREAVPMWERAQERIVDEIGKESFRNLLDSLRELERAAPGE